MRLKIKRVFYSTVCLLMSAFIFVGTSCQMGSNKQGNGELISDITSAEDGLHQQIKTETNEYIIKNKISNYKIVLPENANEYEELAYAELLAFFYEATNIKLQCVSDSSVGEFSENNKYFVLGETTLNEKANVKVDKAEVKSRGFVIKTVGLSVFVVGGEGEGTLNGVYELLSQLFDFDFYAKDVYSINKNVTSLKLMNYDIKEAPDIELNNSAYSFAQADNVTIARYRMVARTSLQMYVDGRYSGHNAVKGYLQKDLYLNEDDPENYHPEWYDSTKSQPCFTANGDSDSRALMLEAVTNKAIETIKQYPNAKLLTFAIEDSKRVCVCDACVAAKKKYGSDAGAMVEFVNDLRVRIDQWIDSEEGEGYSKDFYLLFYAYLGYEDAPVIVDENGEMQATIKCVEGVVPFVAPIYADYCYSMYHEKNVDSYNLIKGWQKTSDEIHFYWYDINYYEPLTPYNTFDSLQANYQLAKNSNVSFMYNLGLNTGGSATGWSVLKVYLQSKLGWNVNCDVEYYTQKFFENYYAETAPEMRAWFNEYRAHAIYIQENKGFDNSNMDSPVNQGMTLYLSAAQEKFWPKSVLERWLGYANEALSKIESQKTLNPEYYNEMYRRIVLERASLLYMLVQIYGDKLENVSELKQQFLSDTTIANITMHREGTALSSLLTDWNLV